MPRRALMAAALLVAAGCGHLDAGADRRLSGTAENLWGDPVDLDHAPGLVLIQPFSPANCGYCMIDGQFLQANYLDRAVARGGRAYHMCLFNPQRDILGYLKHMRLAEDEVLTYPSSLHRYHRDGFPFLIAFRDGDPIYSDNSWPYEEKFRELHPLFWPGIPDSLLLTSPAQLASGFANENRAGATIFVVPDGDDAAKEHWRQVVAGWSSHPGDPKFERELTAEDLGKNLYFTGYLTRFSFAALRSAKPPIAIDDEHVTVGPHRFARDEIALRAAFPNPHNRQRYVVVNCGRADGTGTPAANWADYALIHGDSVIVGLFAKHPDNRWVYADSLFFAWSRSAVSDAADADQAVAMTWTGARCNDSTCPALVARLWSLGDDGGRFPAVAPGSNGACWVTWQQHGDVFLTQLGADESAPILAVEDDASDSFDPVLASTAHEVWVFYLNDRDGFYRLRARCWRRGDDGLGEFSQELSISEERAPLDVETPAVAVGPDGSVLVAWSEWRANQRFLKYRRLRDGVLGPVATAALAPSELADYANAWYPSLAYAGGQPWGAWNQHYPAILGVCAGNLEEPAVSVTRGGLTSDDCENGGYPTVAVDAEGGRWVFWESFGWDVLQGTPQRILASRFDPAARTWLPHETLDENAPTFLAQTPCAACDGRGRLWVAWSGRGAAEGDAWAVYVTHRDGATWTPPQRISPTGTSARAPRLCASGDDVWVAWHAGTGDRMHVQAIKLASGS